MKLLFIVPAVLFVVMTALPVVRRDHWVIRACDFPRLQIAVLGVLLLGTYVALWDPHRLHETVVLTALAGAVGYQAYWIWPYTPYAAAQVRDVVRHRPDRQLSVLVANLWIENRDADAFLALVRQRDPDLILTLEVDAWWGERLTALDDDFPHSVCQLQDNAYGMALYSRLPLRDVEVRFLMDDAIPSVRARVELPSGHEVTFYGVHPRPPHPEETADTVDRDAELLLIGHEIGVRQTSEDHPVVIAGDFNDVSWSYVTLMMRRISGLLDPRIGRGPFNTFHAQYPFLRCPLDHVLHSAHFSLARLERCPPFGSDHFALLVRLQIDDDGTEVQNRPYASSKIRRHARQEIAKAA